MTWHIMVAEIFIKNRLDALLKATVGTNPGRNAPLIKANDTLAGFVQELRNYFLREPAPDISFNTRFDSQGKLIRRACISLKHLNGKSDWKARSQVFLQDLTGDVDILELATTFRLRVTSFQDWFRIRLLDLFKGELAVLDEKIGEIQKLYYKESIKES